MAVSAANIPTPANGSPSGADQERISSDKISGKPNGWQRPKHQDPARDLSIQVLEKFSLVTRFARETTSQLFREMDGFTPSEGRKHDHALITASHDSHRVPNEVPVVPDPLEVLLYLVSSYYCILTLTSLNARIFAFLFLEIIDIKSPATV